MSSPTSCGPWKGIGIISMIFIVLIIIAVVVLYLLKLIHFGKPKPTEPTQEQIIAALKKGVTIAAKDNNTKTDFTTNLKMTEGTGINLDMVSALKVNNADVQDFGGNKIAFRLVPVSGSGTTLKPQGVYLNVTNTKTGKIILVDPTMKAGPPA